MEQKDKELLSREEQKIKASKKYGIGNPIFIWDEYGGVICDEIRPAVDFAKGVEWADSNLSEASIAKYLYEKKGYPITLNGDIPSFEEIIRDLVRFQLYQNKE